MVYYITSIGIRTSTNNIYIYINATYMKLGVLPKGCVFLSILGALFDGQSPETNESSISVLLWSLH